MRDTVAAAARTRPGREVPVVGPDHLILSVKRAALRRCNMAHAMSGIFYTHPWEIDPEQPRVAASSRLSRFRHYNNLHLTAPRLDRLLRDFAWDRMDRVFAPLLSGAPVAGMLPV